MFFIRTIFDFRYSATGSLLSLIVQPAAERAVLVAAAEAAGLDGAEAAAVFDDADCFAEDVREAEAMWQNAGIQSVPAIVINRRHLISGGQPPEVFARALREIAEATILGR